MEDGSEARQPGKVPTKRQGAKSAGGKTLKGASKCRVQFHLHDQVIKRLGVHCSLAGCNQSAYVEKVLLSALSRYGQGKELFPAVKADYLVEDINPDAA